MFVIVDSGFRLSTVAIINASVESLDLCLYLSPGYFLSLSIRLSAFHSENQISRRLSYLINAQKKEGRLAIFSHMHYLLY